MNDKKSTIFTTFSKFQLADEFFADAYQSVDAKERSWLKSCIARQYTLWGEKTQSHKEIKQFRQGFSVEMSSVAVDWSVFCVQEEFASGSRFLATLMPALLAGVKNIYILYISNEEKTIQKENFSHHTKNILLATELAGLTASYEEETTPFFCLSPKQALVFLQTCIAENASTSGRLLLLGDKLNVDELILEASRGFIPVWTQGMKTLTAVCKPDLNERTNFSIDDFKLMQPDIVLEYSQKSGLDSDSFESVQIDDLCLKEGQEGVWFWTDLPPDYFKKTSICTKTTK